jgi:hypothetical protein
VEAVREAEIIRSDGVTRVEPMGRRLHNSAQGSAFRWSAKATEAALQVALDERTDEQIATAAGVSRRTLATWKLHPEFAGRVEGHRAEFREAASRRAIAQLGRRVAALNERWLALQRVIEERAADPAMRAIPGGETGLLRPGPMGTFDVDVALLRALLDHEKRAAQELGQWGKPLEEAESLSDAELEAAIVEDLRARGYRVVGPGEAMATA